MRCKVFVLAGMALTATIMHAFALPAAAPGANAQSDVMSDTENARVYCYNRDSGYFLHWGACRSSHPRVYCRNTYTGQFLHWGACY